MIDIGGNILTNVTLTTQLKINVASDMQYLDSKQNV